mmetsp:Transcript_21261/g.29251  ORF Transcript_21261/g.29251 Transcript_21261/m.29251 type:complete len:246 (-) Transcript_21261:159-896(-)|eukprot:CAMPEP_0170116192 /NCGR_PEP_ID=MMETSP0020_2-20130122/12086_1 /TAXON_ID=98059 /ORGANISM="Dinobryon sp., Strain UTEXLB2267" /LENGTH=245 /DNA_ID=CAMNT_0010344189 /DNA_START=50 /DNA_END=787 /DNA_ORIENTATION=-
MDIGVVDHHENAGSEENNEEVNLDSSVSADHFGGVEPVPNWYELSLEEIYEKINPFGGCKTARAARTKWAKTLQKTLGVVANNLLREMKKKKFVPEACSDKIEQRKKPRAMQKAMFSSPEMLPGAPPGGFHSKLLFVRSYLNTNCVQRSDLGGGHQPEMSIDIMSLPGVDMKEIYQSTRELTEEEKEAKKSQVYAFEAQATHFTMLNKKTWVDMINDELKSDEAKIDDDYRNQLLQKKRRILLDD